MDKLKDYIFQGFPSDIVTRRRLSLIYLFIPIPVAILVISAVLSYGQSVALGAFMLVYLFFVLAVIPVLRTTKNIRVAENMLVFAIIPVQLLRLVAGGEFKMVLFLIVPWAVFAFFLLGRRMAIFWIGLLVSVSLFLALLGQQGVIGVGYSVAELLQIYAFLIVTVVILYLFDRQRELYQEIARREQNKTQKEHRKLEATKSGVISIMAHQVRTPLSVIRWYVELLEDQKKELTKQQQEFLEVIRSSADNAIESVGELLAATRAELGTFLGRARPVDFLSIYKEVRSNYELLIQKKNLVFTEVADEAMPMITIDNDLLRLAYHVLISNAVKFTDEGGKIHVSHTMHGSRIVIAVSDTGIGISNADKPKVFTKLFRSEEALKNDPDGFGLALYTVKKAITDAGGRMWFVSPAADIEGPKGKPGTTFFIEFPLS